MSVLSALGAVSLVVLALAVGLFGLMIIALSDPNSGLFILVIAAALGFCALALWRRRKRPAGAAPDDH
jgi:hypothetical protein